jgi:dihydroorotase
MAIKRKEAWGRTAFVNARLLDPATGLDAPGALLVDDEAIADVGPRLFADSVPEGAEVVDCQGLCLAPGLVDMRVQLREPGEEHKGTLVSEGRAAVAGGVTSFICLPNTLPVIDDMSVVEYVARRARLTALAKVYPYAAITKRLEGKEITEFALLAESGAVAFTDGEKAVSDAGVMRQAMMWASTFNLLLVQHPEDVQLAGGVMNSGEVATRLGLSGIPRQAEIIQIERDIRLVELTGARLHFAHVSTAEAVDVIGRAKDRGLPITCDTAPPYFALNELAVGDYRTFAKLSPPLRAEADRLAVIEGLKSGVIDAIASDHAPQDEESKRLPLVQAAFGGVGLETLLPVTLELWHGGHMPLLAALGKVTCAAAGILGLRAGKLEAGAPADLILFDPDRGWQVTRDILHSKSKNTPFDERPVQGRVMRTVIDGRTVFEYGEGR